ncbi:hypothetical protein ACQEVF_57755 [Nonomuraea polychroma]|uniref:hypothetical protein n=1 Tax=Nonomuraea polychroma TaxID=46176 RepID=UPI003D8AF3B1
MSGTGDDIQRLRLIHSGVTRVSPAALNAALTAALRTIRQVWDDQATLDLATDTDAATHLIGTAKLVARFEELTSLLHAMTGDTGLALRLHAEDNPAHVSQHDLYGSARLLQAAADTHAAAAKQVSAAAEDLANARRTPGPPS